MKQIESRHWIFGGLFVIVIITMVLNINLEVRVTPETDRFYACLDSLPAGATVIVSFDHEASSLPEIRPLALAVLRHAFSRDLKLVGTALLAEGTAVGYRLMTQTADEYGKTYGEDYVYLGFKPQYIAAILSMGESIPDTYPEDYLGQPYRDYEMLVDVENYDDIAAVISIADGSLTTHWIEYGASRYNIRIVAAVTAAMMTTYDPYLASGQLYAMFGGLRGATEYEQLIGIGGSGKRGMLAQSAAHVYVMVLIIAGNIIYFRTRRRKGSAS
ncbi:MAG: hypothetical protein KOO62_03980 [candidate division Zixibacteria bacterium]|nr:hypothetical protein [candidate division Zixibacteria bacterium]